MNDIAIELSERYEQLYTDVTSNLLELIYGSGQLCKKYNAQCISIEIEIFVELAILNGKLTLIDSNGYQYDISVVDLEDLISILN